MTGPEHYRAAELLLASCQLGSPDADGTEYYAAGDDPPGSGGINTLGNALAAAQVHATLAAAAATAASLGTFLELEAAARAWSAVTG